MKGALKMADAGILATAMDRMTSRTFDALENLAEPKKHKPVQATRAAVCNP